MHYKHGHFVNNEMSPEYRIWNTMVQRCTNPKSSKYPMYGGRGIHVCDAWRKDFRTFLSDMGRRPSIKHSLERIHNDGDYEPKNVRWATATEQANNRRSNKRVTFSGKTQTISEWSREIGIDQRVLGWRLRAGWSIERALR